MRCPLKVAFATSRDLPDGWDDDHEAARLAGAEFVVWDDPAVDWEAYDRVVIRSVWDYSHRVEEFLVWCAAIGPGRLRNVPEPSGEVVVKPNVSAGARDTGRFGPARRADALALIERIRASGRVAILLAYLAEVDRRGETALVFIAGELSHVLRKRAVLRGEGEAPLGDGPRAPAAVMLEDDLVVPGEAEPGQAEYAAAVVAEVTERFGTPLYVRVDIAHDDEGRPLLMELEAIEPCLYLDLVPGRRLRQPLPRHLRRPRRADPGGPRVLRLRLRRPRPLPGLSAASPPPAGHPPLAPVDTWAVCSRKCRG